MRECSIKLIEHEIQNHEKDMLTLEGQILKQKNELIRTDRDLEDKKQFETKLLVKRNRRFRRTKRHRKGNSEPGNGIVPPSQDISEILCSC